MVNCLKMLNNMIKALCGFIIELFYPTRCINCGEYGLYLCFECYKKIDLCRTTVCFYCGKISKNGKICSSCKRKNHSLLNSVIWIGQYEGVLKELIHNFKYSGVKSIAPILSEMATQALLKRGEMHNYIIVPVPIHQKRYSQRGFNQSEEIARIISKRLNLHGGLALKRVVNTKSQIGLNKIERQKNIKGSIICNDKELIRGKNVMLIDDVATTGATLNECAKLLKEAGAKSVEALIIARD